MIGITISLGFDELPADGQKCSMCGEVIIEKAYYPYVQVGNPEDGKHIKPLCEKCYLEVSGTGGGQKA